MYMMNLMNMMTVVMRYVYRSYGYRSTGSGNYGTYLLMTLAVILIPLIAQINVKSTFSKYSQVRNLKGLTADQVARMILDSNGLYNVRVEHVSGKLTDNFDPRTNVVHLSDSVYGNSSVAAIGVAAHECGHACQHAEEYGPIMLRAKLVPITNICSTLWYFILIIGLLLSSLSIGTTLVYISIIMFAAVVVFQLVTLPCEFNASDRALNTLESSGILEMQEIPHARKVLKAAALTYVASLLASIIQLVRLLMSTRRR